MIYVGGEQDCVYCAERCMSTIKKVVPCDFQALLLSSRQAFFHWPDFSTTFASLTSVEMTWGVCFIGNDNSPLFFCCQCSCDIYYQIFSKVNLCTSASIFILSPSVNLPAKSSAARGFSRRCWIVRFRGLAPKAGS